MMEHEKINYVELPSSDLLVTQQFYTQVFGWEFEDYGSDYTAFSGAGLDGGFYLAAKRSNSDDGAALVVLYSKDLESTQLKIEEAGGVVVKACFDFPGGRRFHFADRTGNELAVWSDRL